MRKNYHLLTVLVCIICMHLTASAQIINLQKLGSYTTGIFDEGATEIAAFDPSTNYLFSVNGYTGNIDVLDLSDITQPILAFTIDLEAYGASANSVASMNGIIAVAVEDTIKQNNGRAVFFDAYGNFLSAVEVGALPDMIKFTPNGKLVLVANEGEPNDDYTVDPLGTVSIININGGVATLTQSDVSTIDFTAFDTIVLDPAIRVFGPGALPSMDFEPEFIAVSGNSRFAYVTLQENNAIAIINLQNKTVKVKALGYKDYNVAGNEMDGTDKNAGVVNMKNWPVYGMYMPDAIESVSLPSGNFLVMANEGDVREYDGFAEASRISALVLDSVAFPDSLDLQNDNKTGRLNVTTTMGDIDDDGDFDQLFSFGGRSFSIRTTNGALVYDSGNDIETITYAAYPDNFNCSSTSNTKKGRSDDKGPEPEGLTTAKILDKTYVFVGLERIGGIMAYDITDPVNPEFKQYINTRNFTETPGDSTGGDLAPEGMLFIPAATSPNGRNLLVVSFETSGSIGIFSTDNTCGPNKVLICYEGNTYCVKTSTAELFVAAGATYGACSDERFADGEPTLVDDASVMAIFPNPATSNVNVTLGGFNSETTTLSITDITGRIVYTQNIANALNNISVNEINTSLLTPGMYIITAKGNDVVKTQKLVIE